MQPLPKGFRDIFKRTESQEDINGGLGKQKEDEDEPHFITSAIEMDRPRSPRVPSVDGFASVRSIEDSSQRPDPYRVV